LEYVLQIVVACTIAGILGLFAGQRHLAKELAAFQLDVAKHYVSAPELDKLENALMKLTDSLNKVSETVTGIRADLDAAAKYSK
jgi:hypothetical protein